MINKLGVGTMRWEPTLPFADLVCVHTFRKVHFLMLSQFRRAFFDAPALGGLPSNDHRIPVNSQHGDEDEEPWLSRGNAGCSPGTLAPNSALRALRLPRAPRFRAARCIVLHAPPPNTPVDFLPGLSPAGRCGGFGYLGNTPALVYRDEDF